jgi:hypothetical protein
MLINDRGMTALCQQIRNVSEIFQKCLKTNHIRINWRIAELPAHRKDLAFMMEFVRYNVGEQLQRCKRQFNVLTRNFVCKRMCERLTITGKKIIHQLICITVDRPDQIQVTDTFFFTKGAIAKLCKLPKPKAICIGYVGKEITNTSVTEIGMIKIEMFRF